MALERGKLTDVVQVSAGTTQSIVSVADNKKVYIKSIICHAPGPGITTAAGQVYFVPNGSSAEYSNKIFDVSIESGESVMLEPSYPLVIDATGDALHVGCNDAAVNFIITGDKEA